jgi:hypothetical protein
MKNKSFSHFMAFVCGMMLCVASCEKMNVTNTDSGDKGEANVRLSVGSFELEPFSATRTMVSDVCSRISFLVYDRNGDRIRKLDQQVGDADFGQADFLLAQGRYFLVVTAHSGLGNPTSTNAQKIAFTNKTGFTDTFLYADSLTVGDTDVEQSLNLRRIVAMVRFLPIDAVPVGADSIRFHYTGGSGTFDAVAGGWGVVNSEQMQWYGVSGKTNQFDIYTIPHEGDDDQLKVKVNTYHDTAGDISILSECEIEGIPVKRNHITTCRGYLFSPVFQQKFNITIDDVWDNDSITFNF